MPATARAQPNIALVKYWGKRDTIRNLPAVGSISITLRELYTDMLVDVDADLEADQLTVNGRVETAMLPRISRCLDDVLGHQRSHARIESSCNFPIAAGLASSAAAFAAVVVAAAGAQDLSRSKAELASHAGRASGSAARSLYDGFVELRNRHEDIELESLLSADAWPLSVVVAVTEPGPKPVSSGEAMERSRRTSPFYSRWVDEQDNDLEVAREAIRMRDFKGLAHIAEHNCLKMHSVMWASRPPMIYWNSATLSCMQTIRQLQSDGVATFFTIDAGPQVKAVCVPDVASEVEAALAATTGVTQTMVSGLGSGAHLVSES